MILKNLLFLSLLACLQTTALAAKHESEIAAIATVIDDFHDAAAHGDVNRYLDHLTEEAVFMGTDEWERCRMVGVEGSLQHCSALPEQAHVQSLR